MTKRSRDILFFLLVVLFLTTAPLVIFYFQGYRFDFEKKEVVKTGGLYFKVLPHNAQIYLDGDFKKKTSGLTGSVLIKDLLPREYQIEIRKTGYHSWQKNLAVKESQVTEAKHIILFPRNPNFALADKMPEIEASATSSDKQKVVEVNEYEIRVLFLEKEEEVFIARFSKKIGNVFWLTDHYLIFSVGDKIKIAEIDDRDKINIINLATFKEPQIFWESKDKKLYVRSDKQIYLLDNLLP